MASASSQYMDENIDADGEQSDKTPRPPKRPYTIPASYGGRSSRDYNEKLERLIRAGKIPKNLIEESHLVSEEDSAEAKVVVDYIRKILDRLAMASTGKPNPPMKIFLCDQHGINTGIIPYAETPILIVGLGLLDTIIAQSNTDHNQSSFDFAEDSRSLFGEDHLAAVLGHERFHLLRHNNWEDLENGRPEETAGDVYAVIETEKAGYNPHAMGDFFKLLHGTYGRNDKNTRLSHMLDEHPHIGDRIRNTELALANLQLTKKMSATTTMIPAEVVKAVDAIHYTTLYEQYKADNNFENASPADKIRLISAFYEQELAKKEQETIDYRRKYRDEHEYEKKNGKKAKKSRSFKDDYEEYTVMDYDPHLMTTRICPTLLDLLPYRQDPDDNQLHLDLHDEQTEQIQAQAYEQLLHFMAMDRQHFVFESDNETGDQYKWVLEQLAYLTNLKAQYPLHRYSSYNGFVLGERDNISRNRNDEFDKVLPQELLRLRIYASAFRNAKTRDQAIKAAQNYRSAENDLRQYAGGIYRLRLTPEELEFPSRQTIRNDIEKHGFIRLPWEDHVSWMNQNETADLDENDPARIQEQQSNALIREMAKDIGSNDPRISGDPIEHWTASRFSNEGTKFTELTFDDHGNITALALTEKERLEKYQERFRVDSAADLYQREYEEQARRDQAESEIVEQTDWSQMEKDFWGFVADHMEELEPTASIVPGKFPFASAFMEHLKKLVQDNPETWQPTYHSFLTGNIIAEENDNEENRIEDYGLEGYVRKNSLPHLMQKSEEKYFGYAHIFEGQSREFKGVRGKLPDGHPMEDRLASHADKRERRRTSKYDPKKNEYVRYKTRINPMAVHKQPVEIAIKIDASHPFLEPVLALKPDELRIKRKVNMIAHFRYANPEARNLDEYYTINPRKIFNLRAYGTVRGFDKFKKITGFDSYHLSSRNEDRIDHSWEDTQAIELLGTLRKLDKAKAVKRFAISELDFITVSSTFDFLDNKKLAKTHERELKKLVNRQLRRNRDIDLRKSTPITTLINNYIKDHGKESRFDRRTSHNVFAFRPILERTYQNRIRERIMELPLEERARYLRQLMALQIKDPDYRKWAVDEWIASTDSKLGLDDGETNYKTKFIKLVEDTIYKMDTTQGMNCVIGLLDAVEAQKDTSLETKEILIDHYSQKVLKQDGGMRVIESAIATCANDPELRQAFLEYITEPLTKKHTLQFAALLKDRTMSAYQESPASDFVSQFYNPEKHIFLAPSQEQVIVDYLHQNFWAMPFAARTVYLDRVLFPVGQSDDQQFDEAVQFVLDKVLPEERKFSAEAKEALIVYLDNCPPELRRTTFSAILATTEESSQKGDLRPGQVLSYVLGKTGAAGGQLLQAAHSYLSSLDLTDPDLAQFRDDLKDTKIAFEKPLRWEVFERIDETLPEDLINSITHYGTVIGSGSTAFVLSCNKQDTETAIKLMRKDVVPIAELNFERYAGAFKTLAKRHDYYQALPGLIDAASKLIDVSTNGYIAKEQIDYAAAEYNDLRITVNGQEHRFHVAQSLSAGTEYIETERLYGQHLNDLTDPAFKLSKSIAIETAEIYRLLKGKATDKDRHGGQQAINGLLTGMFDVGQLPYDTDNASIAEPLDNEKQALGRLIGIAFNAAAKGESIVETLTTAIVTKDWQDAHGYLVDEQRSLLARMDVHNGFGKEEEDRTQVLTSIFSAVIKTGHIDPVIYRGLTETITLQTVQRIAKSALKAEKPSIDIQINDGAAHLDKTDRLSLRDIGMITAQSALKRAFGHRFVADNAEDHSHTAPKSYPKPTNI